MKTTTTMHRTVTACGDVLRGYFVTAAGVEHKVECPPDRSWVNITLYEERGHSGTESRVYDCATGMTKQRGEIVTEDWTGEDEKDFFSFVFEAPGEKPAREREEIALGFVLFAVHRQ